MMQQPSRHPWPCCAASHGSSSPAWRAVALLWREPWPVLRSLWLWRWQLQRRRRRKVPSFARTGWFRFAVASPVPPPSPSRQSTNRRRMLSQAHQLCGPSSRPWHHWLPPTYFAAISKGAPPAAAPGRRCPLEKFQRRARLCHDGAMTTAGPRRRGMASISVTSPPGVHRQRQAGSPAHDKRPTSRWRSGAGSQLGPSRGSRTTGPNHPLAPPQPPAALGRAGPGRCSLAPTSNDLPPSPPR
mmetsp:Transcript_22710/g.63369  ORF Transcript_22710/g.63369 Transcript_22710/m.63369 type:complete len:242 (-) Transcript_22710:33-758(-)